jgi:guanosine-3',5'-bis(diphosphate) 3'-pyrophosphohydrolase
MIVEHARDLAQRAHHGQTRKYTGEPYINHPKAVVALIESVGIDDEATIAAAWLHDVVEDCNIPLFIIKDEFGDKIADLVIALTDPPARAGGPNRAARKMIDRARLAAASEKAQSIKCADIIDNTLSIVKDDPNFAITYMREIAALMPLLTKANRDLWTRANNLLETYQEDRPHV